MWKCPKCKAECEDNFTNCWNCSTGRDGSPPIVSSETEPLQGDTIPIFAPCGPRSFNGFGTTYYGERDNHLDGSYVTTEWVILYFVPVIPLRSLRVIYRGATEPKKEWPALPGTVHHFDIVERQKINWKQVLCVYGFALGLLGWVFAVIWFLATRINPDGTYLGAGLVAVLCVAPIFILLVLRWSAKRKTGS